MDFVYFNLAKKLKDLGFNVPFFFFYREDDKDKYVHHTNISKPLIYCDEIDDEVIIAPTIAQVLKWLRKEKKILITIIPQEKNLGHDTLCFAVYKITEDLYQPIYNGTINTLVDSYEELYLAGIDYVLDNLI